MKRFEWLSEYLARLHDEHILVRAGDTLALAPARQLTIDPEDWRRSIRLATEIGCRFAGIWGDPTDEEETRVYACLVCQGDYLILTTLVAHRQPSLPSLTPVYPGADRLERHLRDLLGISFQEHPDERRWTRHQAWRAEEFPLRADFPVGGRSACRTHADTTYPFAQIQGSGVYEIPVGPVHAGIIEPGHFRFQAVGEEVLRLEERLGFVHKGIEKIAVGRDPEGLARLAGRVSGDTTLAHSWAACQAMERATGCQVPPRALALRALLCERERIVNHLGDIGAICNDVGFAFAHLQCAKLREQWLRRNASLFGHRLLMDVVIPGGVGVDLTRVDLSLLRADHVGLRRETAILFDIIDDHPSLEDRLMTTGLLPKEEASRLGCTGYVGKASGLSFDVRCDSPYPPYDKLTLTPAVEQEGDVAARVRVRISEIRSSLALLEQLFEGLPEGEILAPLPTPAAGAAGLGIIDGWRGEILCFIRFDAAGRIARFFPRDPSWFTWPALERHRAGLPGLQ